MKKELIGYYNYTVVLTYCGMLFAFTGILMAIQQNYWYAVGCLMIAGLCDMFDGAVASTKKRDRMEKNFGIQIDSLSDLVSFGVLPGIIAYMIAGQTPICGVISGLFVLCGLIRLAYYNVLEAERQSSCEEGERVFLGVPITTIAVLLPIVYVLYDYKIFKSIICFPILMGITAIGYIIPIKIKKPKIVGKICICIVGLLEAIAMIFLLGWGAT